MFNEEITGTFTAEDLAGLFKAVHKDALINASIALGGPEGELLDVFQDGVDEFKDDAETLAFIAIVTLGSKDLDLLDLD